ncbi:lysophospholipid acyltransferase family protein [Tundrisphaera sp. TA3]|uniref:lysophospholipid acyltransferase family protein n=1 Tax=Tundrisphaera sp. TA3 TaxID=3435775 RepID=UPI003EBC7A98
MSPWLPLALSATLLILPRFLRPPTAPTWEFRGFLAFLWYLNAAYCTLMHRLQGDPSTLPPTGPAILIANHTCNIDHFLLQAGTGRQLGFLIAREFYDYWAFHPFCKMIGCIPVNRDGRDLAATRAALRALADGRVVPVFPEGRITPSSGRELGEGKPGVAFIALRAKVPVVPAYIWGAPPSKKFLVSLCSPSHTRILYGPPIDPSSFVAEKGHDAERAAITRTTEILMGALEDLRQRAIREDRAG